MANSYNYRTSLLQNSLKVIIIKESSSAPRWIFAELNCPSSSIFSYEPPRYQDIKRFCFLSLYHHQILIKIYIQLMVNLLVIPFTVIIYHSPRGLSFRNEFLHTGLVVFKFLFVLLVVWLVIHWSLNVNWRKYFQKWIIFAVELSFSMLSEVVAFIIFISYN